MCVFESKNDLDNVPDSQIEISNAESGKSITKSDTTVSKFQ